MWDTSNLRRKTWIKKEEWDNWKGRDLKVKESHLDACQSQY